MGEVDVGRLDGMIDTDFLRTTINGIGKGFVRGPTIAEVVLDAEVSVRATFVVTGRQYDAAESLPLADHRTRCRSRQNAVATDKHATESGGRCHAQNGLDGHIVVIAAIATKDQGLSLLTG